MSAGSCAGAGGGQAHGGLADAFGAGTQLGRDRGGEQGSAALHTATGSYRLVMAAVALCSVVASLAIARAHHLDPRHDLPPAS